MERSYPIEDLFYQHPPFCTHFEAGGLILEYIKRKDHHIQGTKLISSWAKVHKSPGEPT